MKSLAICVVSNRDHAPDFTRCLATLIAKLASDPLSETVDLKIKKNCSLLSVARQGMIDECKAEGVTHILWLDDDMVFPPDLCHRLAAQKKKCVGVNSLRKNPNELHYTARGLDGQWVASKGRTGIEQVAAVGLALFLMDLSALDTIPAPHFEVRWNDEAKIYGGEDMYFCRKLAAAKEPIYIDHGLSNDCGHIGSIVYTFAFYDRFK